MPDYRVTTDYLRGEAEKRAHEIKSDNAVFDQLVSIEVSIYEVGAAIVERLEEIAAFQKQT